MGVAVRLNPGVVRWGFTHNTLTLGDVKLGD